MAKAKAKESTSVMVSLTGKVQASAWLEDGVLSNVVEFDFDDDDNAGELLHAVLRHFHGNVASHIFDAALEAVKDEPALRRATQERAAKEVLSGGKEFMAQK